MTSDPHWTIYLSALLTPTVAVLGFYIAYRQWRTAQNKLKLDLFERRLVIYEAAKILLATVSANGKVKDEELGKFLTQTRSAKWLLNTEIAEYFSEIYRKALDLRCLDSEIENLPISEERSKNVEEQRVIKDWLEIQFNILDTKFSPFLRLKH